LAALLSCFGLLMQGCGIGDSSGSGTGAISDSGGGIVTKTKRDVTRRDATRRDRRGAVLDSGGGRRSCAMGEAIKNLLLIRFETVPEGSEQPVSQTVHPKFWDTFNILVCMNFADNSLPPERKECTYAPKKNELVNINNVTQPAYLFFDVCEKNVRTGKITRNEVKHRIDLPKACNSTAVAPTPLTHKVPQGEVVVSCSTLAQLGSIQIYVAPKAFRTIKSH